MSWILFFQIIILMLAVHVFGYALIETYFQKKFDKDLELHDVKNAHKSYKDYHYKEYQNRENGG